MSEPLLKTYAAPSPQIVPTSIDFVSTEPQQLLAAYSSSHACVLDLETGRSVLQFEMKDGECVGIEVGQVSSGLQMRMWGWDALRRFYRIRPCRSR